jgi:hypothetical protein
MTQEDKNLLLVDLCGRLPYGVACKITFDAENIFTETLEGINVKYYNKIATSNTACDIECVEPYLRPMSSMTKEEKLMYEGLMIGTDNVSYTLDVIDWLNKKMFDYRGLIERGLALEAPRGMYYIKEQ